MLRLHLLRQLGIVFALGLAIAACGPRAPAPPREQQGTITTTAVTVVTGSHIAFEGRSSLPDGARLRAQLLSDGASLQWWPTETVAEVENGLWEIRVAFDQDGTPASLSEEEQYVLRVWEQGDRAVEAEPFAFDLSGPAAPGTGVPRGHAVIRGAADVQEVDLMIMESFPVQVAVAARGTLRDSCTEIDDVSTSFDADTNTFMVEIATVRDSKAVCAQILAPFAERFELDVLGLPAGTYTVEVNGVRETFTLDVENVPTGSARTEVSWQEAQDLIMAGEVRQVTQLHSLEVALELKDGRRLATREPTIDAVFDVVKACGEPCSDMVLATE